MAKVCSAPGELETRQYIYAVKMVRLHSGMAKAFSNRRDTTPDVKLELSNRAKGMASDYERQVTQLTMQLRSLGVPIPVVPIEEAI